MRTVDLTINELISVKSEINDFIINEFNILDELQKNNLRYILKKIVFLKYLIRQSDDDFRLWALTSDLIYILGSIKKGETRYYYLNLRSIIEQSLRLINNIGSTDTMTNSELMEKTKELIFESGITINMDIIKNEYSNSCLYVHGNEKASFEIVEYYRSCVDNESMINNLTKKLNVFVKLLKELFDLIIISHIDIVDAAFHRRKSILKFLIGEQSFLKFEMHKPD